MATSNNLRMYIAVLSFLGLSFQPVARAQDVIDSNQCFGITRGRDFSIGFIENISTEGVGSRQLFIMVVAFNDQQTEVTISSKHRVADQPLQESFMIEAGGFMRTTIPVDYTMIGTERSLKGIRVTASSDVSVYGLMYQDFTSDAFLGIPINNLGSQYVVMTTRPTGGTFSEFAIVGTQDSTSVQVTLRSSVLFEGQTYNEGDVLTFTINDMEAVQIQSSGDLTGSIVQSDKPVAIFSGNQCVRTANSACDTLTEQLVPVQSWGMEHVYTAARDTDSNIYRIVAYFAGTSVVIPGVSDQVLNAGEFWEGRLTGSGLVSSDQPTLMMQILATIAGLVVDPSLIQIPSKAQFGFLFGFTTPPFSGGDAGGFFNFINIVVDKDARETVHLNGAPINSSDVNERDIPGTSYLVITMQLPKGEGVYYVAQTDQLSSPLSVIVYGYEDDETYGYAAGLSLPSNEQLFSVSPYYFREIGAEVLTITVPCFETNVDVQQSVMCRFETGIGDVLVSGDRINFYTIICVTPYFYKIGLTQVSISLDGGGSYSYSGIIYVASQEDFPPLVTLEQENQKTRGGTIDLTADDPISLSWDPEVFRQDVSHIDVMMRDSEFNDDDFPVFNDGIKVVSDVSNTGTLTISPTAIMSAINEGRGITVAAFYLTPSEARKRRNIITNVFKVFHPSTGLHILDKHDGDNKLCSTFDKQLMNEPVGQPACPCNLREAIKDPDYEQSNHRISFYHPGADDCYRSTSATDTGSGQQCCYTNDGPLIVGPPGGGTADRYSPAKSLLRHWWYDVVPWLACCYFTKDSCDKYYRYRPSDDCTGYTGCPPPARGFGDPHITTFDGKQYTFNGAGEVLMLSSTLQDVIFQARMEVFRQTDASVYTAFVIQTKDSKKVQVQRSAMDTTLVLIDGVPLRFDSGIRTFHYDGVDVIVNADLSEVRVIFTAGISLIIYIKSEVMSYIAQLDTKFQGLVEGLLGNMNGDLTDDFRYPNDAILDSDSSLQEIHEYGLEWIVKESESIFTYLSPFDYSTYHFPEFVPTFVIPDPNTVSQEIKDLCGDSVECIFDAVTTGSLSFAAETLAVEDAFNIIKEVTDAVNCGDPGQVQDGVVSGTVYLVNNKVEITCNQGYILEGAASLTCQPDGNWSSNLPRCRIPGTRCKTGVFGTGKLVID